MGGGHVLQKLQIHHIIDMLQIIKVGFGDDPGLGENGLMHERIKQKALTVTGKAKLYTKE
ncbi:hypothetical protein D9M69_654500 [compost metagenome]